MALQKLPTTPPFCTLLPDADCSNDSARDDELRRLPLTSMARDPRPRYRLKAAVVVLSDDSEIATRMRVRPPFSMI
ncbi:MAG: hypothetical protein OQJ98_02870 [Candidatus Pacebacteria bacterium]|nr:hypothetical protein [Candidatus Paceibacterota bacterium]